MLLVAVLRDRHAFDQLHDEVGPAAVGRAGVEHLGDVRMVHHRQRLPLGLEAGDHLPRVHARLDDLERDRPLDRLGLLGHEDDAHAAFADLLQQLVGADDRAGPLGNGGRDRSSHASRRRSPGSCRPRSAPEQRLDPLLADRIVAHTLRPSSRPAATRAASLFQRCEKDSLRRSCVIVHG